MRVTSRSTEYPALLLDHFRAATEQALVRTEELSKAWQYAPQQHGRLLASLVHLMVSWTHGASCTARHLLRLLRFPSACCAWGFAPFYFQGH